MKSPFLRAGAALACALTLASCGGSGSTLALGGSVNTLNREGLVLLNNGANDLPVAATATSFFFPTLIGYDTDYNVTVKSSPAGTTCKASNNSGRSSTYDVTTVVVNCTAIPHALGGTISNLKGKGLVLVNGPEQKAVDAGATTFQLNNVGEGFPYGVTILNQPENQTCTITGGTGTMGAAAVNNIAVACT